MDLSYRLITMKLVRFSEKGKEKPGVILDDSTSIEVSGYVPVNDYSERGYRRCAFT